MKPYIFAFLLLISIVANGQDKLQISNDTIRLFINEQNTIFVKAVFNRSDTLILNFDTGTTELVLTNKTLKNKLSFVPKLYSTLYDLKIGSTVYQTKLYDAELSGHGTDGRFGWDLFKGKIVELNYDKGLMIVHPFIPRAVAKNRKSAKFKIQFFEDLLLIKSTLRQSGVEVEEIFLFDSGYQRTVLLDNELIKEKKFPVVKMDTIKKAILRGAQGNEIPVITLNLETLKLGKYKLNNVPAQLLTTNKPLRGKNIHILGNEVLKRFNTFLDFQENTIYLIPNHLFEAPYIDKKKSDT